MIARYILDAVVEGNAPSPRGRWLDYYVTTRLDFEVWVGQRHITVSLLPAKIRRTLRPGVIPVSIRSRR